MPTFTGETGARIKELMGLDIVSGVVNTAKDIILTKKNGATINVGNVGGSGGTPSTGLFSSHRINSLIVPRVTYTVLPMDTEEYDLSNWFDTVNGRFTPQLAGYYRLSASIHSNAQGLSGSRLFLLMYKNGLIHKGINKTYPPAGGYNFLISGTIIVYANGTTDYFQPAMYHDYSEGINVMYESPENTTYFQGELIAAA
jgi:hypothetical protein